MNEGIRKLETKISQALCHDRRMGPHMGNPTTTLEDCHRDFVAILPWLQPHPIRRSHQGRAPNKEECEALKGPRVTKGGPQTGLKGDLKPHTSSVTT